MITKGARESPTCAPNEEEVIEYEENEEQIQHKAKKLAHLIKKSKHFVVFTGAGVSTSANVVIF